ncbi:MAG: hypothetical protein VW362_12275, partial [Candidatus Nanopelagicales bacterium]
RRTTVLYRLGDDRGEAMRSRRHIPTIAVVVLCLVAQLDADPPPRGLVTEAVVVDVYDGDTLTVQPLLPAMRVRLLDCWAPEVRTRDAAEKVRGYESRDHLRKLLPNGSRIRLHIPTSNLLEDSLTLGRVLGRVWRDTDGDGKLDDVSSLQVDAGHATKTKQ